MAETSGTKGTHEVVLNIKDKSNEGSIISFSVPFLQKVQLLAELVGSGDILSDIPGGSINGGEQQQQQHRNTSWDCPRLGTCGHGSTLAFASTKRFPLKQVPVYILTQVVGSTLASVTVRLIFTGKHDRFIGTLVSGSYIQGFLVEFLITFFLMFVISGVATDSRAIGELAGIVVGATVVLNVLATGPITGTSMNPARSLGPAMVWHEYRGIWVYMIAPVVGAVAGAWAYNIIRYTEKPIHEITKTTSFLKASSCCCGASK